MQERQLQERHHAGAGWRASLMRGDLCGWRLQERCGWRLLEAVLRGESGRAAGSSRLMWMLPAGASAAAAPSVL